MKDFSSQQMMLSSGVKQLEGKTILSKGKKVRTQLVKWLANPDKLRKAFSFEIMNRATSEDEECTGSITGAVDISWKNDFFFVFFKKVNISRCYD